MANPNSPYFNEAIGKNLVISFTPNETSIYAYGHLFKTEKPFYDIPIHKPLAFILLAWRDESPANSSLAIAGRRLICGLGLGGLSIIGLIDTVIRIALAFFTSPFPKIQSKKFLSQAFDGLIYSVGFATYLQPYNAFSEKIINKL